MNRLAATGLAMLCLTTPATAQTRKISLRIVETSDVHGCFFPYNFIERKPMRGTLARVSSYVSRLRKEYGDNLILLDNGDILQGQPTCYYYNYIDTAATNIAAEVTNYMGYDAGSLGNHDIETGHAVYDKWMSEVKYPMLGANIISTQSGKPYASPYTIIRREGIKIAVLGMLTPAIPNWLNEKLWSGLCFDDIKASARYWMERLRKEEQPDIVIGLFHSGWEGGITTPLYTEDETHDVAREIPGFDIIFYGHDHTPRRTVVTNGEGARVLCLDPSCNATKVGDATIEIETRNGRVTAKTVTGDVRDICGEPVDEDFMKHFRKHTDRIDAYVSRPVGTIDRDMHTRDCFFGSAPFTDLVHNLQLAITGADISFNAPLSFNVSVPAGMIRVSDMFKLYKYENNIYVLNMTGEEIRKHLEMSYDQWVNTMTSPDDHIMLLDTASRNDMQKYGFKNMTFNFDSAAGIDYEVDVTRPDGQKVRILRMSDGRPFDEKAWYRVVMNSYRGNGGGELLTRGAGIPKDSLDARIVYRSDKDQRFYLMKEIERMKTVSPRANGNWRFVPEEWARPAIERDRKLIFGEINN